MMQKHCPNSNPEYQGAERFGLGTIAQRCEQIVGHNAQRSTREVYVGERQSNWGTDKSRGSKKKVARCYGSGGELAGVTCSIFRITVLEC